MDPVDYSSRSAYRRPPTTYRRLQWLARLLTRLGLVPRDVVNVEVAGRRSGKLRRTTVLRTPCGGEDYLVALAGESEWVRNVRAADGEVTLDRRGRRHPARLVEIPPLERPPVIRAYLHRQGRDPDSPTVARQAESYFGIDKDASLDDIASIAEYYPVFRIETAGARTRH